MWLDVKLVSQSRRIFCELVRLYQIPRNLVHRRIFCELQKNCTQDLVLALQASETHVMASG